MIYISRTGSFNNPPSNQDSSQLAKIQIENSLALGWKKEDIMLITNFDYEYGGIKATVLKGVDFFELVPQASKFNAIIKMFENRMIKKNEIYWFHDLDAYQQVPFIEGEIDLTDADMALVIYGKQLRWNTGSFFFNSKSKDIFEQTMQLVYKHKINEEMALTHLTNTNEAFKKRVKSINRTYNFTAFSLKASYYRSIRPIKVVHFHPNTPHRQMPVNKPLDYFKGNNYIDKPLLTQDLIKLFRYHRIT